ncbi:hypothetical protein [Delftia acidovorans]|uniref:hypothetical protein n=1 Tax=Delftia acidovorans TaxID=80866 RepID=UPI00192CC39D|nr:hypothetical protein [Delftia acidovorans]
MTAPAIKPRPDQIDALTQGLRVPLPAVEAMHLEIIAECLSRAFHQIRHSHPTTVASGSEAEVTALLEARLNEMCGQDPFWGQLVLCAVRGKESVSFDGSHIEKRPDLSIYLSSRSRNFPLIVEAKILDTTTAKTATLYCDKGLRRFLVGEYAWATQEAFMVAYVRDGSSIAGQLTPLLTHDMAQTAPNYAVQTLPAAISTLAGDLASSRHARNFTYLHQAPPSHSPGAMAIWHLWLQ